jgi:DUF2892 family protein
MAVERGLRLIAGIFVVGSALLGMAGYSYALWFTVFVGLNLFQSAFTNWCPMMPMLRHAGCGDGLSRAPRAKARIDHATQETR